MNYFLSKTLYIPFMPLFWIIGLICLAILLKKYRRKILFSTLILLFLCANPALNNHLMLLWEVPPTPLKDITKQYDAAIVLSGVTNSWKSPKDRVYLNRGADRIMHAIMLYKKGIVKKLIVTGSYTKINGEKYSEAEDMKKVMLMCNVNEEDIIVEDQSKNTRESAVEVQQLLKNTTVGSELLLITSAFHIRRSVGCYKKVGVEVDSFATDFMTSDSEELIWTDYLFPKTQAFQKLDVLIHEIIGYIVYKILGYC